MRVKVARMKAEGKKYPTAITPDLVENFGPQQVFPPKQNAKMKWAATSPAWTETGGEIMAVDLPSSKAKAVCK